MDPLGKLQVIGSPKTGRWIPMFMSGILLLKVSEWSLGRTTPSKKGPGTTCTSTPQLKLVILMRQSTSAARLVSVQIKPLFRHTLEQCWDTLPLGAADLCASYWLAGWRFSAPTSSCARRQLPYHQLHLSSIPAPRPRRPTATLV